MNSSNEEQFAKWSGAYPQVKLVSDGSTCNEERLGAVGCIELAVRHLYSLYSSVIVLAKLFCLPAVYRDTLFLEDFKLSDFVEEFLASKACSEGGAFVPCYRCKDDGTLVGKSS